MKCRPGDVVMFTGVGPPADRLNGMVAQLLRDPPYPRGDASMWLLEEPVDVVATCSGIDLDGVPFQAGDGLTIRSAADGNLIPLRYERGDDLMLQLLGLPPLTPQRLAELADEMGMNRDPKETR